ncbi:sensor histidine kinase [Virgibacillus salexigens]|uniref:histidine kinase n=1 Tax=Virgibacillus kapii TaxID=1638645 RepID=A0ABQ2DAG9_9BACI|nr:sensor histidine kinase [Virgibacillus kapii]GGJ51676.1 hypothetical protein GCM10007111_12260 [Virgibacillus kapii]
MRTIRGKLIVYSCVFIILFQITAISIYVSSNQLSSIYNKRFERFLILNTISQQAESLYSELKLYVNNSNTAQDTSYFQLKNGLENQKDRLLAIFNEDNTIELKNYRHIIETFIYESELTMGFVIKDDMEQYTKHLEETRAASNYIQAATLELIDRDLTDYQLFYQDMQERNQNFFLFILFLSLSTILLAVFFAIWFSKGITMPIQQLSDAAKEVSTGELVGAPINIKANNELKLLGDTFHKMRLDIHQLVSDMKDQSELDRLVNEMEIKHLQNQINPHFLFNTLNTVSKMAYLEDAASTSKLIDATAALLRHSLGHIDKNVSLREEVDVVADYFHIQKVRFSERIQFQWFVDEACLDIDVPRLTLQPLVENAFIHGIEGKEEGGTITLTIYESEKWVVTEVADDGIGMDPDDAQSYITTTNKAINHVGHSTGIGLSNVIRRLQLCYQQMNVAEIDTEPGKGTTIRLLLPKDGKEDEDANYYS